MHDGQELTASPLSRRGGAPTTNNTNITTSGALQEVREYLHSGRQHR